MTTIDDLTPPERKRQREALRRRLALPGLRPGLLAKYQNTHTSEGKWEFLKQLILDPQNLSGLQIEAQYESMEEHTDSSAWQELPLEKLRQEYSTPAQRAFLENSVVAKQTGRDHPQDPTNPDMRLYWVYKEGADTRANKTSLATRVKAMASVASNKAASQALHDGMTNWQANFGGKGGAPAGGSGKGGGVEAKPKPAPKPKKAILYTREMFKVGELTSLYFLSGSILLRYKHVSYIGMCVAFFLGTVCNFPVWIPLSFDHFHIEPWSNCPFLGRWRRLRKFARRSSIRSWRSHILSFCQHPTMLRHDWTDWSQL